MGLLAALGGCSSDDGTQGGQGGSAGQGGQVLRALPKVVTHPEQPMVVDIELELDGPGHVSAVSEEDPGVRARQLQPGSAERVTVRLRGVQPESAHTVTLDVTLEDGRSDQAMVDFTALPPAPYFVGSWQVQGTKDLSQPFTWFDYQSSGKLEDAGIYAVDRAGTTRAYLPRPGRVKTFNPSPHTPTAPRILADGSVAFVQEGAFYIVDELGREQVKLTSEQLGVAEVHHELIELPNGRFMALGWQLHEHVYPPDTAPTVIASDAIVEFDAAGTVHWSWDSFDHLDPGRKRADFDQQVKLPGAGGQEVTAKDWTHANGLSYRESDGLVVMSLRHQDWVVGIERATGNVRWRLGDEGDFQLLGASEQWFYHQHAPEFQPDGTLLLYDNAFQNPHLPAGERGAVRAIGLRLDETAMTATIVARTQDPPYVSPVAGDVDRLPDGHWLMLDSFILDPDDPAAGTRARIRAIAPETGDTSWALVVGQARFSYRAMPSTRLPGEPLVGAP